MFHSYTNIQQTVTLETLNLIWVNKKTKKQNYKPIYLYPYMVKPQDTLGHKNTAKKIHCQFKMQNTCDNEQCGKCTAAKQIYSQTQDLLDASANLCQALIKSECSCDSSFAIPNNEVGSPLRSRKLTSIEKEVSEKKVTDLCNNIKIVADIKFYCLRRKRLLTQLCCVDCIPVTKDKPMMMKK